MSYHVQYIQVSVNNIWKPAGAPEQDAQGLLFQIHLSGQSTMHTLMLHTSNCANMSSAIALKGHVLSQLLIQLWLSAGRV